MKLKRSVFYVFLLTFVMAAFVASVSAAKSPTGNGSESGKHYTLNFLGKKWNKGDFADTVGNPVVKNDNGHRIFVKLEGKTRILLQKAPEGESFNVIDADGTDGKAIFQLPDPDPVIVENEFVSADYTVYIRMLGKPSGQADMNSGFIDEYGVAWISLETIQLRQDDSGTVSRKSPPKFEDVTKELFTIYIDITDDGVDNPQRYGIFDNELYQYFWDYNNSGLRHVQIRFYPVD